MILEVVTVGDFQMNAYVIGCSDTRQAVVIDPGDEFTKLKSIIEKHHLKINYILLTHAHVDHIMAVSEMKLWTNAPICLHKDDEPMYAMLDKQAALYGFISSKPPNIDHFIAENDLFCFGNLKINALHTPGHSPGGVSFVLEDGKDTHLFTGDALFSGSIGRTDLWKGNSEILIQSIKSKLLSFPDNTMIYPGHDKTSTIGSERRHNPYLQL